MIRASLAAGAAAAVVLMATGEARAQAVSATGFGDQGQFIIGAERLVPLFAYNSSKDTQTQANSEGSTSDSQSGISLLFGQSQTAVPVFYNIPRVGFDYTIIPHLTLGGSIGAFFSLGGTHEVKTQVGSTTQTTDTDEPSRTAFGINPRVGYILPLTDIISIWPRGGFSFWSASSKQSVTVGNVTNSDSATITQWALDLEGLLAITPWQHFGFTGGLALDVPLTGSSKTEQVRGQTTTSRTDDFSSWHVGLTAGLIGYF